jgi:TPR repeat protein
MRRGDGARTPQGAFDLGLRYYDGEGVPQDHREAARLFLLAADQGHASAQYNAGTCYAKGDGVIQDYAESLRFIAWPRTKATLTRSTTPRIAAPRAMACLKI